VPESKFTKTPTLPAVRPGAFNIEVPLKLKAAWDGMIDVAMMPNMAIVFFMVFIGF